MTPPSQPRATTSSWTGPLVGLAAVIAAAALFVAALTYAGILPGAAEPEATIAAPPAQAAATATPPAASAETAPATAAVTAPVTGTEPATALGASRAATEPGAPASMQPVDARGIEVEGWARLVDADVDEVFAVNEGWADNDLELSIGLAPGGAAGLSMRYTIRAAAPNDYVGAEWDLAQRQDWRGYVALEVPIEQADAATGWLVLQWHELSGEVWRHRASLPDVRAPETLVVPLDPEVWEWADWSDDRGQIMDLDAVGRMGIFVGHAGPTAGEVRVGPIRLSPQ